MLAQLLFDQLHCRKDRPLRTADAKAGRARRHDFGERPDLGVVENGRRIRQRRLVAEQHAGMGLEEGLDALHQHLRRIFATHRQRVLAGDPRLDVAAAQDRVQRLLDIFRRAFLDHQNGLFAGAEFGQLVIDQRIGDVEHVQRHGTVAIDIGKAKLLQRAHDAIIHAAQQDDADIAFAGTEIFVELAALDKLHGGRPALLQLLLLMDKGCRRQDDAVDVADRIFQRLAQRELRPLVVLCFELAVHMAAADADLQHHGCIGRFRKARSRFRQHRRSTAGWGAD